MDHLVPKAKRHRALAALGLVALLPALYLWGSDDAGPSLLRAEEPPFLESSAFDPRQLGEGDSTEAAATAQVMGDAIVVDHNYEIKHSRRKQEYYETHSLSEEEDVDTVVASIPGTFRPTPDCPVPRVLLLLYGQVRSFAHTHKHHAQMASQASGNCYLAVAVTDEEICMPDPNVPGRCDDRKERALRWDQHEAVAHVHDADKLLDATGKAAFDGRLFATVYQSRLEPRLNYNEKVHHLWGVRMQAAIRDVVSSFASNGTPLDPERTVVIRSRFDILPTSYPLFDWEEVGPRGGLFQDSRGNAIVYAPDFGDCQPDMHMYTTLRGMIDHVPHAFTGQTPCRTTADEEQEGPLTMDDDWNLCRSNLLRTNGDIPLSEDGLWAIPVGKNRRLYCACQRDTVGPSSADFEHFGCYARFGEYFSYSLQRDQFRCPVASAGTNGLPCTKPKFRSLHPAM